jgi:hypothetical protein
MNEKWSFSFDLDRDCSPVGGADLPQWLQARLPSRVHNHNRYGCFYAVRCRHTCMADSVATFDFRQNLKIGHEKATGYRGRSTSNRGTVKL